MRACSACVCKCICSLEDSHFSFVYFSYFSCGKVSHWTVACLIKLGRDIQGDLGG